jgi:hypothetical protein
MHTKILYTFYGIFLSAIITPIAFALTTAESQIIESEQKSALRFTGSYQPVYDQLVDVYTYETICKGYYTVEDNGIDIVYTGFGDLADQYTYSRPSHTKLLDSKPTTTDDKTIVIDTIEPDIILKENP